MDKITTSETAEALLKDIDTLKQDMVQIAADVKGHASAHLDATRQMINERFQAAKDAATERPLAIFAVGFVLGFLFAVRLRK